MAFHQPSKNTSQAPPVGRYGDLPTPESHSEIADVDGVHRPECTTTSGQHSTARHTRSRPAMMRPGKRPRVQQYTDAESSSIGLTDRTRQADLTCRGPTHPTHDSTSSELSIRTSRTFGPVRQNSANFEFVETVTNDGGNSESRPVEVTELELYNMLNSTRRRIEAIRAHTDRRYFMNLASADPSLYTRRGLYVVHKDSPKTIAVFSLTGVVTSAKLRRITGYDRRITVLPFREQWIGIASVLGNIFKRNVLFFKSSVHGLVFSTAPFRRQTPASRQKTCRIGTARPAEDTVPVYDGRLPFKLTEFRNLRTLSDEIEDCSVILLTFSVSTSAMTDDSQPGDFDDASEITRFNIQEAVVIQQLKAIPRVSNRHDSVPRDDSDART